MYGQESIEGSPLVLREGARVSSQRHSGSELFHNPAMFAEILSFVRESSGLTYERGQSALMGESGTRQSHSEQVHPFFCDLID